MLIGILIGCVLYWLIMKLFQKVMYLAFKYESLGPFDAIFLLDDRKNLSNILACSFLEPYEFERMKIYLFGKTANLHKCRSKLVKSFGLYWYQEMDEAEWIAKRDDIVILKEGIHNEKDLADYMC